MTLTERTAIALQDHAAWQSACQRMGHKMYVEKLAQGFCLPFTEKWCGEEADAVAGLYELARKFAQCDDINTVIIEAVLTP